MSHAIVVAPALEKLVDPLWGALMFNLRISFSNTRIGTLATQASLAIKAEDISQH